MAVPIVVDKEYTEQMSIVFMDLKNILISIDRSLQVIASSAHQGQVSLRNPLSPD